MIATFGRSLARLEPASGWLLVVVALATALCPALVASDTTFALPDGLFAAAGVFGLALGALAYHGRWRWARGVVGIACGLTSVALLVLAAGQALPPLGLVVRDLGLLDAWLRGWLDVAPKSGTFLFLSAVVRRLWDEVQHAPANGEVGARLLVCVFGVLATFFSTAMLGSALVRGRTLFGWSMPLLATLATITIVGGGSGWALLTGLALLFMAAALAHFQANERRWLRTGIDYSEELRLETLTWAGGLCAVALLFAWLVPTPVSNPLADLIWRDVELPSGIAVLSQPRAPAPKAQITLSTLPIVSLGVSLEQQPPDTVALQVRLNAPLPDGPEPHYWRARVLNVYTGRAWTSNARTGTRATVFGAETDVPDTILQEITDQRRDRHLFIGLADVVALDHDAEVEKLADGTAAAFTTEDDIMSYQALSRLNTAPLVPPDQPPPDLRDFLGLPRNLPARVGDLARAITDGATTPEAQAIALETYLRELPYAYEVQPISSGTDAVDQFLFEMRRGYCTYYASAMAVMARSLGIPSRVAIGYATGEVAADERSYTVREADAHAWPELYLQGRWVAYEPTPVRQLPVRSSAVSAPADVPVAAAPPEQVNAPLVWMIVLAGLAVILCAAVYRRTHQHILPIDAMLADLAWVGQQAGVPWNEGWTLRENVAVLIDRMPDAAPVLGSLVNNVERARYSRAHVLDPDSAQQRAALRQLGVAARRTRKE